MQDASESGSLLCCSTFANEFDDQKPMECGLIKGRSYTIVGLQTVSAAVCECTWHVLLVVSLLEMLLSGLHEDKLVLHERVVDLLCCTE